MTAQEKINEILESDYTLDSDGFVRKVRKNKFNGNGLHASIGYNDLEALYLAGHASRDEELRSKQHEMDSMMIVISVQSDQIKELKEALSGLLHYSAKAGIGLSVAVKVANEVLKKWEKK